VPAGATEAAFCVLALQGDGRLPPHVWDGEADPELPRLLQISPGERFRRGSARICMSNSFALREATQPSFGRRAMKQESPVFPRIEQLVPHRGAMLWLDRLTGETSMPSRRRRECRPPAGMLDERGYMPAWIGIRIDGAGGGRPRRPARLARRASRRSRACFSVARVYRVGASRVAAGTLLRITARVSYAGRSGFGAYDCAIRDASAELATATLKVYEPDDAEAFFAPWPINR